MCLWRRCSQRWCSALLEGTSVTIYAMSAQVSRQLADLDCQFDANTARAQQLFAGLTTQQLAQHAPVDGWSIAECLEHLTLSLMNPDYLLYIDEETGRAPLGSGPYKKDWLGALLAWSLEPPYRMKTKTLPAWEPQRLAVERVLPDFLKLQQRLKNSLRRANGRAIDKVKIHSPFNQRIRYNVFSFFHVMAAHQRRHLWQAERVRERISTKAANDGPLNL